MTHYDTLGVPKDAKPEDIKRAYRRRSKDAHPDRGGDHSAMVAINRAFDMLNDPEKRARYDQTGEDGQPQKPLDAMARDAIMQIFMATVEKASDYDNVIDHVERALKANVDKVTNDIANASKRVTRLERSAKRLKCNRSGDNNFLAELLADQIVKTNAAIENARNGIAVIERAREMLSDFSWEVEAAPAPTPQAHGGVFTVFFDPSMAEQAFRAAGVKP